MPRVTFVKKARKAVPSAGINIGDSYYWWQFAYCPKSYSKTPPKPQQLTRSDFQIAIYELQDRVAALTADENLVSEIELIKEDIETLRDEQEEKKSNMPESLQESNTGELLQERYDNLDNWYNEIDGIDTDVEEDLSEEEKQARLDEILEEMQNIDSTI